MQGARSVKPDIDVELAYLADEGEEVAFGDPVSAKTFAEAFIDVYQPDVILPLAGSGSRGIIEAACEAGILAVGTDIDVAATHPELAECIVTSVTKDYEHAVRESIFSWANGALTPEWRLGLADGHVGVTDEWTRLPGLPVDLAERYAQAEQAVITGQVETCPGDCGAPVDLAGLPAAASPARDRRHRARGLTWSRGTDRWVAAVQRHDQRLSRDPRRPTCDEAGHDEHDAGDHEGTPEDDPLPHQRAHLVGAGGALGVHAGVAPPPVRVAIEVGGRLVQVADGGQWSPDAQRADGDGGDTAQDEQQASGFTRSGLRAVLGRAVFGRVLHRAPRAGARRRARRWPGRASSS